MKVSENLYNLKLLLLLFYYYFFFLILDACFNDEDDYILKNLTKSFFYKKLVSDKGSDKVEERLLFLDIDTN